MKKIIEKYGLINCTIVLICTIVLLLNSVIVEKQAILEISDNVVVAYILNFLAGCQGMLGKFGSMSYEKVFLNRQFWRCITHIYLHAGAIHMVMNMAALLVAGKYIEKKYGSLWYLVFFNMIAIVDAIIVSLIFSGESVGASAGIFATIGVLVILLYKKQISIKKPEIIYLIAFFVVSLVLGIESLVVHLIALAMGLLLGFFLNKVTVCRNKV